VQVWGAGAGDAVRTVGAHDKGIRGVAFSPDGRHLATAGSDGLVSVLGDATRSATLLKAELQGAAQVIVAPQRDDTAALVTLTARQLNKRATIVAAVREDENVPLLKQSGADTVVTSSSSAGRLLGVSMANPHLADTLENLMTYGRGLDLVERPVAADEVGRSPRECADLVVAVVRRKAVFDYTDPQAASLRAGDHVISIRQAARIR